jgi:hypothetical protein
MHICRQALHLDFRRQAPVSLRLSRTCLPYARLPAVSLLTELDAFFIEHQRCGDQDAGVDGPIVWIACPCGASMARRADEDERATAG